MNKIEYLRWYCADSLANDIGVEPGSWLTSPWRPSQDTSTLVLFALINPKSWSEQRYEYKKSNKFTKNPKKILMMDWCTDHKVRSRDTVVGTMVLRYFSFIRKKAVIH